MVRAFADDTAMVLRSWRGEAKALFRIFAVYAKVSLLELNLQKTVGIPLWHEDLNSTRKS